MFPGCVWSSHLWVALHHLHLSCCCLGLFHSLHRNRWWVEVKRSVLLGPVPDIPKSSFISLFPPECSRAWDSSALTKVAYSPVSDFTSLNSSDLGGLPILNGTAGDNATAFSIDDTNQPREAAISSVRDAPDRCYISPQLGRVATANRPFQVHFNMHIGLAAIVNRIYVVDHKATIVTFKVEPVLDSGGTLRFSAKIDEELLVSLPVGIMSFPIVIHLITIVPAQYHYCGWSSHVRAAWGDPTGCQQSFLWPWE